MDLVTEVLQSVSSLAQISLMIDKIEDLVTAGDLAQKDADKLIDKLEKTHEKLTKGENHKAIKELERFIDKVKKLVDKGKLSSSAPFFGLLRTRLFG